MKKILFGIFAHPDDEAFGPCGTLIKEVKEGAELHLFLLTSGEAGQNPDNLPDLGSSREAEWRASTTAIGAFGTYNLKLQDGKLNNTSMQLASKQIEPIIRDIITSHNVPVLAEFITFESNGLSGHIDHIVASRVASFVFYRLKDSGLPLSKIRYFCINEDKKPTHSTAWIFADKGRPAHEIDETVDATEFKKEIVAVMRLHYSQRADCERLLQLHGDQLGINHFMIRS